MVRQLANGFLLSNTPRFGAQGRLMALSAGAKSSFRWDGGKREKRIPSVLTTHHVGLEHILGNNLLRRIVSWLIT